MFAKKNRLPVHAFIHTPSSHIAPDFLLRFAHNSLSYNRYGFVVSKKVDKRATVRNHTKRKFRSIVEKLSPSLQQGYDILFSLKRPFTGNENLLEAQILQILKSEKLL